MSKRITAIILAIVMIMGIMPNMVMASGMEALSHEEFTDMPKDWSTTALENAVNNGLIGGHKGKILPKENLTRAEMAAILNRAFKSHYKANIDNFTDVSKNAWYYDDMAKAVGMKTFEGFENKLNPEDAITREEAFVVIARAFKTEDEDKIEGFKDADKVANWAKADVFGLIKSGYIKGSHNKINPKANITRAEFAQLMDNIVTEYITESEVLEKDFKGNVLVNVPSVKFKDLTIDGDLIIGEGAENGEIILNNVHVTGRVVVSGGSHLIFRNACTVSDLHVDNRHDDYTVEVSKDTKIEILHLESKATIIGEGSIEKTLLKPGSSNSKIEVLGTEIVVSKDVKGAEGHKGLELKAGETILNEAKKKSDKDKVIPVVPGGTVTRPVTPNPELVEENKIRDEVKRIAGIVNDKSTDSFMIRIDGKDVKINIKKDVSIKEVLEVVQEDVLDAFTGNEIIKSFTVKGRDIDGEPEFVELESKTYDEINKQMLEILIKLVAENENLNDLKGKKYTLGVQGYSDILTENVNYDIEFLNIER